MTLEIDVWVVMNGTRITGSVFLILRICIDFKNILISFFRKLVTRKRVSFFQQDTLSGHTAYTSMHCWESVFGVWHISSECKLTFSRSEAMSSNCMSTCGACWKTKFKVTILSLQTTWQKRLGNNAFNLTNKLWTCSESHVRCVACLQAGLNHFCAPDTNCNRVNYILWTPIQTTLKKMVKAVQSTAVRIDLRSEKSYCRLSTLYCHNQLRKCRIFICCCFCSWSEWVFVYIANKT
jgi:hypothetical protein